MTVANEGQVVAPTLPEAPAAPLVAPQAPIPTSARAPALSPRERLEKRLQTLYDRIERDTADAEKVAAELAALAALENLAEGTVIHYKHGRAPQAEYVGTVLGVADTSAGRRIKVYTGSGFDAETHVIAPAAVIKAVQQAEPAQQ